MRSGNVRTAENRARLEFPPPSVLDLGQHRTDGRAVFRQEAFLDSNTLAHTIVDIVEEKQAMDIVLLDVREQTSIADYFVIATVDNERRKRAPSKQRCCKT